MGMSGVPIEIGHELMFAGCERKSGDKEIVSECSSPLKMEWLSLHPLPVSLHPLAIFPAATSARLLPDRASEK